MDRGAGVGHDQPRWSEGLPGRGRGGSPVVAQVADAAVVGVSDERLGEVPWGFVVPTAGSSPSVADLEAHVREHLVAYKVPVGFELLDALPRNEVGKVLAADLAKRARAASTVGGDNR
ncbi:MAG: hypothetical protein U5R31_01575 [Acidimicrobiia bacterium]|nr:hypothetical protein [Acidimicrobiia bacterium]